ncbi:MAG: sensor histidine kinase KdpD [Syntrophales bacterium]|jgi:two-component system sensor histidine kinase KdpD|nr:sensor histidine kinase KdpD [Syntrophales bacterium]
METKRPDPDELLGRAVSEETRKRHGKLKIFFGAAPGVGKTYAMLGAAQKRRAEGVDIVVGVVETHGRKETETLLDGLEILPRRIQPHRGRDILEFDIDAALARSPSLIVIDELAHTNAPDSRHNKRWQDVQELLGAGISVYTTVNVQHLESLNDIIRQITGIIVRETIPDSFLGRADEIELIDLPPADLLQRLKEGKVYIPEQAQKATENFFRKGNLIALRELALRRTAEQVDEQMESYRRDAGVQDIWPAAERILVCIGPNPRSIRLIRAARRIAAGFRAEWIAVHVEAPSHIRPSQDDLKLLAEHMRLAESLGAQTATLTGRKASDEILNYARERNVSKIIVGKPTHPRWKDKLLGSLLDEIIRGSGDIEVYVITGDAAEAPAKPGARSHSPKIKPKEWYWSLGTVTLSTILGSLISPYFDRTDIAMIYLLGIVITSTRTGRWPALAATLLSVAAFDFFFAPPYFTFAVNDIRFVVTFAVMFVVANVITRLTLQIREQAEASRKRERNTAALYALSRKLAQERKKEQIFNVATKHISEVFHSQIVILVLDKKGELAASETRVGTFSIDRKELSVARWAFDNRHSAGLGTDTLPGAKALYLPMVASSGVVGVVGVLPENAERGFDPEDIHFLESFVNQTAMAMERIMLAKEVQEEHLKAEAQNVKNTFLSSISHDLRSPLAVVAGAASTLLEKDASLDRPARLELLHTIYEETDRLERIIRNVLNLTRLDSGTITVHKEWQPLEEIIGVVLNRFADRFRERSLELKIPPDLPLIPFDTLLMEQVLSNLMENALRHTPTGTPVEITVTPQKSAVMIEIADRGPGIPAHEGEAIFKKFTRGANTQMGAGIGLSICRVIIEAHGGRIWVENRTGGGAAFKFVIPVEGTPPSMIPEKELP